MTALRVILVTLAALLLGAHFLRSDQLLLAGTSAALPLLLTVRRPWAPLLLRLLLTLGALEWVRTAVGLIRRRAADGEPWTRLAVILGAVALLTAAAALAARRRTAAPAPPRAA